MTAARLLKAARAGDEAEIEALIARGVKGTRKQLIEAARAGETDVVDVLVRSGIKGTRQQLAAAREAGESAVEEALLRSGAAGDGGRLLLAIRRADTAEIEALRREGRLPEYLLRDAVLEAAAANDGPALEALRNEGAPLPLSFEVILGRNDLTAARAFLAHVGSSFDVNARLPGAYGWPITEANTPEMLAVLIDAGADLNPRYAPELPLSSLCTRAYLDNRGGDTMGTLKLALAKGMKVNRRKDGKTALDEVAHSSIYHKSPDERHRCVEVIDALVDAGADAIDALESPERAEYHPEIVAALQRAPAKRRARRRSKPRAAPPMPSDAEIRSAIAAGEAAARAADAGEDVARAASAAFKAAKAAHPPPPPAASLKQPLPPAPPPPRAPAAPSKQSRGGFWAVLTIAGALALLLALVTCGARPAPAAEADSPGWRFMEAVDGDTLAFAVDALPPALSRVLVRVRGVDTPERRRPKCEWERRAGEAATAYTAAALEAARTIDLADMKWGKYSGRVLTHAPVDGRDPVEASIADGHGRPYDGVRRAREAAA